MVVARTIDLEGGLLIGIVRPVDFGYCQKIGIARTIDLEGDLLIGVVGTINLVDGLVIGIVRTSYLGDCCEGISPLGSW